MGVTRETRCRSCNADTLAPILSLGNTPLANRLLASASEPEPRYPLDLVFCTACALVQITETVSPEELFRDYVYFSSVSETVVENARENVASVMEARTLTADDLVLEVASNDGYLLQHYRDRGIPVLGIEPASNIAEVARSRGIETVNEFFGLDLARRLPKASVLHASNVLAHVADLNGFVAGIAHVLRDDGIAVIEVPYLRDMIEQCEFDTIYHEHLCYFSATALQSLLARHGLAIAHVERIPIHGGTLRLRIAKTAPRAIAMIEDERAWGVSTVDRYREFAGRVEALRDKLVALLHELRASGARLAAYGASAKGATLLNYAGIGAELLEYVVDRSPHKIGRLTPGTHLPIVSPDVLRDDRPDYLLLLTWNHATEILRQQSGYRERGGRFIIPVPEPRVI